MSLIKTVQETPDKPAFIAAETGDVLSFGQLNDKSIRLSRLLRAKLDEGDRVAFLMENGAPYFVASWAARRSALRFVPINWHLGKEEAVYIAQNSDARALIASPALSELAESVAARLPDLALRFSDGAEFGNFAALADALQNAPAEPLGEEREGNFMFYSSGTTGRPKGILRALGGKAFGERGGIENLMAALFAFDERTIFYTPAPLYHAAPLGWTMGAQMLGGTAVLAAKFDAEETLRHIEKYKITHAQFVPTHFVRLLKLPRAVRERYDLSNLKMVVHSAAPCPVEVKEQMMDWWGPIIYEYYSASEGGGFTAVKPDEWLAHKGTVGRSMMGPLHVVDDDGHELPPGETGHIMFEGGERFDYHKDREKTASYFDSHGWQRPGDMGWMDAEGYLYLADRASHMIISGGVNIYPQEVESILTLHPAVRDVAIIGVPDPEFGESVKAVVELAPGVQPGKTLETELISFCRDRIAGFKCPRTLDFVDELPRLPTGKLLKREIRKRYWDDAKRLI
jgi:acyl-CoA synthetase (AMP-forming)/AMP-acid ligase II